MNTSTGCVSSMMIGINSFILFSFTCGRWLGRGVDDDSTERLLVGERVSEYSDRGRSNISPRVRSPSVPPPKKAMPVADIQTMLGMSSVGITLH